MIPYADFSYFGLLLYVAVPTTLGGLIGRLRLRRVWIVLVTASMLAVQYWRPRIVWPGTGLTELWLIVGYALEQWVVADAFLMIRGRVKNRAVFYAALGLGLLPMILSRVVPLLATHTLLGFVGLSYVTFRSLDVIIGVQDGLIAELPFFQYLAFLLFFPTISSGPIDRYRRFAADWQRDRTRAEFLQDLDGAVQRVMRGLLYKFILAELIARYWMGPAASRTDPASIVSYMYAYSLYLFFDFAGYSAFAIGVSMLLGIHTPENFNRPFLASNIREFWERWHISLSAWFRDHIYMRFVMASMKGKWFKDNRVTSIAGYFLLFGLMGLWHGFAWYYIVYGLYHALLMTGYDLFSRWNRERQLFHGKLWSAASVVITFQAVCFGLLIFSGHLG